MLLGLIGLFKKKNDLLSLLLNLESLVLLIFIWFTVNVELFFASLFLRVGACEAAVGLGILVRYMRNVGVNWINLYEYGFLFRYRSRCLGFCYTLWIFFFRPNGDRILTRYRWIFFYVEGGEWICTYFFFYLRVRGFA